jgi:Tol biopolymer transport system component
LGYGNTPSWSPDDRQIAFMLNPSNPAGARAGIWLMDADGTNRRWITDGFYPRWSPNGKRLCVHAWLTDGTPSLFLIDAATLQVRPILTAAGWTLQEYGGTWSDDSQRIVFVGRKDGKDHLATIDVNGGDKSLRILYTNSQSGQELFGPPAWSPDGRQIVFGVQPTPAGPRRWWNSRLYTIDADGSSAAVLLEGSKQGNINRGMNWSPDSKKIVFSSER